MKFPWSQTTDPLALQPGNYAFEITKSEEKTSKSGNVMWELTLLSTAYGCKLCHDRIMLGGSPEALNMSRGKLSAMGFKDTDDVEAGHLLGVRGWVAVKEVPADGQYARKLDVDISVKGTKVGYWTEKPGSLMEPSAPIAPVADDTPF